MVSRRRVMQILDSYAQLFLGSKLLSSNCATLDADRPNLRRCMKRAELEADILTAVRRLEPDARLFYLLYCRRQWTLAEIAKGTGWTMRLCAKRYDELVTAVYSYLNDDRIYFRCPQGRGWVGRMGGTRGPELPVRP